MIALERFRSDVGTPRYVLFLGSKNDYDDDQLFLSGYRHGHIVEGSPATGAGWAPAGRGPECRSSRPRRRTPRVAVVQVEPNDLSGVLLEVRSRDRYVPTSFSITSSQVI